MSSVVIGVEIIQLAIGLVFLFSTLGKLRDPGGFLRGVAEYNILPPKLARLYGLLLIPLEAFVAATFLSGWLVEVSAIVALGLLASFLVAVVINLRRRRAIACFCFGGALSEPISTRTIVRIGLLIAGVLIVNFAIWGPLSATPLDVAASQPASDQPAATALFEIILALFLIVIGAWSLRVPDIFRLRKLNKETKGGM